jgi:hypothetical protein
MYKLIAKLIWQKANRQTWQLEIGAYLLKKGCGFEIGQVIKSKDCHNNNKQKVKYITGLTYDFGTNKIYHRSGKTLIDK